MPEDTTGQAVTAINNMTGSFALQNAIAGLPEFNGKNIPLKDFIQDVQNGATYITGENKGNYIRAVISKLRGPARDTTYGETFATIDALIKHLKARFAPGKNFAYYSSKLHTLRMRQGESVGDFYDHLKILLSGAEKALREEHGEEHIAQMMAPVNNAAVDIFIRGLPAEIARGVDLHKPTTLKSAYEEAVRLEVRMEARILPDMRYRQGMRVGNIDYNESSGTNWNGDQRRQFQSNNRNGPSQNGGGSNFVGLVQDMGQVTTPDGNYGDGSSDLNPQNFAGFFQELGWNETENQIANFNDASPQNFVGFVQEIGQNGYYRSGNNYLTATNQHSSNPQMNPDVYNHGTEDYYVDPMIKQMAELRQQKAINNFGRPNFNSGNRNQQGFFNSGYKSGEKSSPIMRPLFYRHGINGARLFDPTTGNFFFVPGTEDRRNLPIHQANPGFVCQNTQPISQQHLNSNGARPMNMAAGQGINQVQVMTSRSQENGSNLNQHQSQSTQPTSNAPVKRTMHILQRSSDTTKSLRVGALEEAMKKVTIQQQ